MPRNDLHKAWAYIFRQHRTKTALKYYHLLIGIALIGAIVILLVSVPEGIDSLLFRIILGAVIIIIYLSAMVMMWIEKKLESKKRTEQLQKFQSEIKGTAQVN